MHCGAVVTGRRRGLILGLGRNLVARSFSSSSEHESFIKDIAKAQPPKHLTELLNIFKVKGYSIVSPGAKQGLLPLTVPLVKASPASSIALLRWPTARPSMEMPVVEVQKHGLWFIANNVDQFIHRILVEQDISKTQESTQDIFDAAAEAGKELYNKGDFATSGLVDLDAYLFRKVGLFPDSLERKVIRHIENGDHVSALVAAEFYSKRGNFPGFARPFAFNAKVLLKLGRSLEAKDAARGALKSSWWTLGCKYEEVARIAEWGDEQIVQYRERVTGEGRQRDINRGKPRAQASLCTNAMKPRFSLNVPIFAYYSHLRRLRHTHRRTFSSFLNRNRSNYGAPASSLGGSGGGDSKGSAFLLPGATMATILMLGALHARRLYEDKKIEEKRERGIELEFHQDVKASFLGILPLRTISRAWGSLTSLEIPVGMRPYVYKAWARAFHSNLEEAALPLEEYASLRDFFVRSLKEGCRPIDPDPRCLVSPVDGTVLRFGELKGSRGMIEQVKGHSYSVPALLGSNSLLPMVPGGQEDSKEEVVGEKGDKSWWRVSLASPKLRETISANPMNGLYYCVIYLRPGDYHRIHSPADWNALVRRHFAGRLFPVNERATRTIRNLYVENERVVLEGIWKEGFMALAAVGATNIGSIELFIEPELRTNKPKKKLFPTEPPEERVYDPEGHGLKLEKGKEVGVFNMGSTVVLVFQAPTANTPEGSNSSSDFRFCVNRGDRVHVGQALGRWKEE